MTDWKGMLDALDFRGIATALLPEVDDLPLLRDDPWSVVSEMPDVTIEVRDALPMGSCGGGYYDRATSTIYIHPASPRRNNFTILHELGHHYQQHHDDWAFVLMDDVPHLQRRKVEEQVSDQFAAEILLGLVAEDADPFVQSPALAMAGLFENSAASRSAALYHVATRLQHKTKWILAVADLAGRVQTAASTYEQFPPKRDLVQPGFARLAEEVGEGLLRRNFTEGLVYQRGRELHDMKVEAVRDYTGLYIFVALTPFERFGLGKIESAWYSCGQNGCAVEDYCANVDSKWCPDCNEPFCSGCGACRCERAGQATQCPSCYVSITNYEATKGLHECW